MTTKKSKSKTPSKAKAVKKIAACWQRDPVTHRLLFIPPSKSKPPEQS